MLSLVKLTLPRCDHARRDERYTQTNYSYSAPFFKNPNGVLIHRIKALYKLEREGRAEPWWIIDYWCGNVGRSYDGETELLFTPGSELVCARCEAIAVGRGEKTSSKLVGRHVCVGVCRPVNVCSQHRDSK